ncbi:hypothetical protein [Rhizobium tubonense]|uniref:hypothetical protein n=1 Tax=Rhizobium tubonense TaxID=484088 RepID=UPI0018A7F612|nr:hypothetical protein [Rhizobium tubonense]
MKIVEPSPQCFGLADRVLARAKEYGDVRVLGAADPFSPAGTALDEALAALMVEMKICAAASSKDRIVATVLVVKLIPNHVTISGLSAEATAYEPGPKSDPLLD